MSKLSQLIQELCPDGVEYLAISEVTSVERGVRVVKSQLTETGNYPVYQNSLKPLGFHTQANCSGGTTFVIGAGAAGEIGYSKVDFWAADDCYYFQHSAKIDSRYLYHVLLSKQHLLFSKVRKASIPRLSRSVIQHLQIPVPPLEVQQEIVRILDSFTVLVTELTTELTAELTARKQQYKYYRDVLLTFNDKCTEFLELSDLFNTKNGYTPSKQEKSYWENGTIPWFRIEDIRENGGILSKSLQYVSSNAIKGSVFPPNSIIIATSATIGVHALITVPSLANQRFTYLMLKDKYLRSFNIKFLYYYCFKLDVYCKEHLNQGNFASVDMKKFAKFKFPFPSLDVQDKIVSVLDQFDALCNDLSDGLPAEIEARQKQYEYYRDKLLTFKEKMA